MTFLRRKNRHLDATGNFYLNGEQVSATADELNTLAGLTEQFQSVTGYPVEAHEVTFTETAGAGVWTGTVNVPAGATIIDVIVVAVALWNSETSASMKVGMSDDDGFFIDVDLKATDLLAGESVSLALAGGVAGAYVANSHVLQRYSASARTVNGIITKEGTTGTAGRTRMIVVFALPTSTEATKA